MISRKIKAIALIGALSLMVGCSNNEGTTNENNTENAVVEQTVDQDVDVENKESEEVKEEETPKVVAVNIKDIEDIYSYFNENIFEITREDFDTYIEISYLDITGNGVEEAIIINNKSWEENINIVTIKDNNFSVLSNEIPMYKYKNEFKLKDGFLVVEQKTGGTGIGDTRQSLYKYKDGKLVSVLSGLLVEYYASGPDFAENEYGTIEGDYTDFDFVQIKEYPLENKREVVAAKHYKYNEDNLSFSIVDIDAPDIVETIEEETPEVSAEFVAGKILDGFGKVVYREEEIDINSYVAVGLPMYDGVYNDSLEKKSVSIGEVNDKTITLSLFGAFENIQIRYFENNNSEAVVTDVGDLTNTYLEIKGDFPTEESYVSVWADINGLEDRYSVSFNIDTLTENSGNMAFQVK